MPIESGRGHQPGVTGGCEPLCGCLEPNSILCHISNWASSPARVVHFLKICFYPWLNVLLSIPCLQALNFCPLSDLSYWSDFHRPLYLMSFRFAFSSVLNSISSLVFTSSLSCLCFLSKIFYYFISCVWVFCQQVCLCTMSVHCRGKNRTVFIELKL